MLILLFACTDPKEGGLPGTHTSSDTGRGATHDSRSTSTNRQIINYYGDCSAETVCWWGVDTIRPIGSVELTILQTGDPAFSCGPERALECGVWKEYHTAFFHAPGGNGADRMEIALQVVDDPGDQVGSQSTLFNTDPEFSEISYLFVVFDQNGAYADCVVDGHSPTWFADQCR